MKIVDSGKSLNLTLTKKEWEEMGEKQGWNRQAMAVPMPEEHARNMARDGIYALLDLKDVKNPMPKSNKTDIEAILQDNGIVQLFNEVDAINVLQLPKILTPEASNIVEIEGNQYILAHVIESKDPKKSDPKRGLVKGVHQDGKIICLDMASGRTVEFSYDQYVNKVKVPDVKRTENMEAVNQSIRKYNHRIDEIDKALGVAKLPLQLGSVQVDIDDRIETLRSQLEAITRKEQDPLSGSQGYRQWIDFLRDGIRNQRFPLRDTFDTLIFLYKLNPAELISGIESGEVQVPTEIRNTLIAIAHQEIAAAQEDRENKIEKNVERQERMESPLPDEKGYEGRLREVSLDEMPEMKYKKATQYQTLQSWVQSLRMQKEGIERNLNELVELKSTLIAAGQYIGALGKGQRGLDYLRSPEGSGIVDDLRRFLDRSESFLKRYAVDVVKDGTINPALMGRAGQLGNALIGVSLLKIYNVIKGDIQEVEHVIEPSERTLTQTPVAPMSPVAKIKDRISKLSQALWSLTFEKRQRIR